MKLYQIRPTTLTQDLPPHKKNICFLGKLNQKQIKHPLFNIQKLTKTIVFICFFMTTLFFHNQVWAKSNIAEQDYQSYKSSKHSSQNWDLFVKSGIEAFHSGTYDVAENSLYKAFNKGCESPIVLFMLALLSENKESFYSAIEYYQMAQKGFKRSNKKHRYNRTFNENYGRALYYSGKIDKAMPILKKAARKTKSYWLLKLLGMISYQKGDALNAVSYLERAVRVRSSDVTKSELVYIYRLLAKLFLYQGEKDGAHRYYQKVVELDPNNPDAKRFMSGIEKSYQQKQMMELMDKLQDM